ncbi:hypothetical protein AAFN90_00895 [Erwiniaceae bacterium CAU 1747]
MDFRLIKMQVENFAFSDQFKGEDGEDSNLTIEATMMFSDTGEKLAKMVTSVALQSPGRYELEASLAFTFKFDDDVTAEQAQTMLEESKTEKLLFPYVHAFLTNFIMSAGYPRPGIPLVLM